MGIRNSCGKCNSSHIFKNRHVLLATLAKIVDVAKRWVWSAVMTWLREERHLNCVEVRIFYFLNLGPILAGLS